MFLYNTSMCTAVVILSVVVGFLIFAGLQRKFAPETLANGFMDEEKGEEIAPTVFKSDTSK